MLILICLSPYTMTTKQIIINKIKSSSQIKNHNGYVDSISENLIPGINLGLFEEDLSSGNGKELESKFKALYSSSALTVNSFGILKNDNNFEIFGQRDFNLKNFERKFPTGLHGTPPNLDFVLENGSSIICFESKYLEYFIKTKVEFRESYSPNKLPYLAEFWFELIDFYRGQWLHLDIAQLIKHSIGIIKNKGDKKAMLVYIYWEPKISKDYHEISKHKEELEEFATKLKAQSDIEFKMMTYTELWNSFNSKNELKLHVKRLKDRYLLSI